MRIRGISDIHTANAFLPEFIEDYNKRFAVNPANLNDAHRPIMIDEEQLSRIFSQQYQRKVSKNLEVSYHNVIYQIQSKNPSYALRGSQVTVCDRNGEITLIYKHKLLPYKIFDKRNQPATVMNSKQIVHLKPQQHRKPSANHPWRRYDKTMQRKMQQAACA